MTYKTEKGFTLVEIAIVLVIIGLLLGGVLKGQELIASSKTKAIMNEMDAALAAFYAYVDKYGQMPGDHAQASTMVKAGLTDGNGDGQVGGKEGDQYVFEHLAASGFLTGYTPHSVNNRFTNSVGGEAYFVRNNAGFTNEAYCTQIPEDMAAEIDRKLDDGIASSGSYRMSGAGGRDYDPLREGNTRLCVKVK